MAHIYLIRNTSRNVIGCFTNYRNAIESLRITWSTGVEVKDVVDGEWSFYSQANASKPLLGYISKIEVLDRVDHL